MTGDQVREARKLLNLSRFRLAQQCSVPENTIRVFEATGTLPKATKSPEHPVRRLTAIRTTLEAAGVVFTDGKEPGVKLRKPDP